MVMSHRNGTDPGTFTVLVLGILIALAVDDWMQGRRVPGWSASTCSCLYATCSVTRRS